LAPGALVIESVKQPKVNGIDKDAANYPNLRPRRLQIKAAYWSSLTTTAEAREDLLLHELLPLVDIEDTDYVRSGRFLIALQAARRIAPEISCEARRIEAAFSGADMDLARLLGRELGILRCESSVQILSSYKPEKTGDEALRSEVAKSLVFGTFVGAVQSQDQSTSVKFEDFFIKTASALPEALGNWSSALCAEGAAPNSSSSNLCGGFAAFLFGATPEQKDLVTAKDGLLIDFDRAAMNFLNRMFAEKLMSAFFVNGVIDQRLVKAAIRSQNWMPLILLGQVHRSLHSPGSASDVLTQGFVWRDLMREGAEVPNTKESSSRRVDFNRCSVFEVRSHVELLLEGAMPTLLCEQVISI
jgi:hypothetical protein